ncbi:charged multivesicular body protein 1b-like [Stegodyphus dumicola]|uniref:charged multivesicular body protein 1b-like n=1 Tax=Stegodyphus dumicola TaxID=202533 RepID=UPI0015B0FDEA|nr:charged multivesicular body protein 1b-like [Stegodyphus dumicola]
MNLSQLQRFSRVAEQTEATYRQKLKEAIKEINKVKSKKRAKLVICKQHETLEFKRLAAKVEAVISKLPTAITKEQVANIRPVLKALDKFMSTMNLRKITVMVGLLEQQFENLDVSISVDEDAVARAPGVSVPMSRVHRVILETAVYNGLLYHLARANEIRKVASAPATAVAQAEGPITRSRRIRVLKK